MKQLDIFRIMGLPEFNSMKFLQKPVLIRIDSWLIILFMTDCLYTYFLS